MDVLADLLARPKAQGAFLLRSVQDPPWSVRVADEAPLSIVAVVRGRPWVIPERADPAQLRPGNLVLLRGPDPYTFTDDPDTPTQVVIHPGPWRATPAGAALPETTELRPRTWGSSGHGRTLLLIGKYRTRIEISPRLLRALPPLLVLTHEARGCAPLVELLTDEIVKNEPGQEAVLDRLLDLLTVSALRAWFARPSLDTPQHHPARSDPLVGRALHVLHREPERRWTVATLAAATGVSRATLARRFTRLVGEPPMTYLTDLRLDLAADLLREPDTTLDTVARRVGYSTAYALSTAFKRAHGVSPQQHRARPS